VPSQNLFVNTKDFLKTLNYCGFKQGIDPLILGRSSALYEHHK
jgi:hypothetical protein